MSNNWSNKSNPIENIKNAIEIIKNQPYKKISIKESLFHDRSILILAGYNKEQIKHYEQKVINALINERQF